MRSWTTGANSTLAHPTTLKAAGRPRALMHPALLETFLKEPFFQKAPPKSTGRDLFNGRGSTASCSTLRNCARRCTSHFDRADCPGLREHSQTIRWRRNFDGCMRWRRAQQPPDAPPEGLAGPLPVEPTDVLGLPVMQVEACAFAWLARQTILGQAGNLPNVTGALRPFFGAIYPA